MKDFSKNFQTGIFQSIGFKEFDEYLEVLDQEADNKQKLEKLYAKCLEDMKATTRRYAKYQLRWIRNRFIRSKIKINN